MGKRTSRGGATPQADAQTSSASSSKHTSSKSVAISLSNGFLAVPVTLPRSSVGTAGQHWIYARKHTASASASSSKDADLDSERTLFLANLPTDTTESHLRDIFLNAGTLSSVKFRYAHIGEEEDEKEEKGEGEDETDQTASGDTHHQLQGRAAKKAGLLKKSKVPEVVALPSLDPRVGMGSQPFLATSSSAHIVFLDAGSLERALSLLRQGIKWTDPFKSIRKEAERQAQLEAQANEPARKSRTTTSASFLLSAGAGVPPSGLQYMLDQHSACRPDLDDVRDWANSRVALYQYRKAHPLPRKIGVRGVTVGANGELLDEDGFIIVQRSGKYGRAGAGASGGGSVGIAKRDFQENQNKRSAGLEDFYRFQMRERKRENLADLRSKFEADKEKVAKLKAGRRFKPY